MSDAFPPSGNRAPDRIELDTGAVASGGACSSKETMREAARSAGKSEVLDRYAADYPVDPQAGRVEDQIIDALRRQRAVQPEPVGARLVALHSRR